MKLKENFFTDAKMVILESMQDGLLYSNLLLKMYLMSLKYNGILMLFISALCGNLFADSFSVCNLWLFEDCVNIIFCFKS